MMAAKSCYSCYYGGTSRGRECSVASTAVCCEDWTETRSMRVRATIEYEIDITAIGEAYQEKCPETGAGFDGVNNWFKELFKKSLQENLLKWTEVDDRLGGAVTLFDIRDPEICYETEEEFRTAVASQKGTVSA